MSYCPVGGSPLRFLEVTVLATYFDSCEDCGIYWRYENDDGRMAYLATARDELEIDGILPASEPADEEETECVLS